MIDETVRTIVDLRDRTLQKQRIAFTNRLAAIERGDDTANSNTVALLTRWNERFEQMEKDAEKDIKELVGDEPIIQAMIGVKGVSFTLAAKVVSMIDIERSDTVSALWRYAGYGVVNGEREKPVKGEKLHYNKRLKATCYLVGSSFLKSNSPYRKVYDDAREHYDAKRPDWTKGHKHNAAMRKMAKVWLSHLWMVWRSIEGLPIRNLYVEEYGGHTHILQPAEFGWAL